MTTEAYLNGWFAHKSGLFVFENDNDLNPYDENKQKYSHEQWGAGYSARHNAVKHGGDLSLDETELYL